MPRRLAALLLDLLLLQLLLLGGSGECITREHSPVAGRAVVAAVADPHAAHGGYGGHGAHGGDGVHGMIVGQETQDTPADGGANSTPDGGAHCMMAVSCAATSLAAHVPVMDDTRPVSEAVVAPRVVLPASPAFSPEPPPPRA